MRALAVAILAIAIAGCSGTVEGAGTITFGTGLSGTDLQGQTTTFARGSTASWRAVLKEPAGAASLELVLASRAADNAQQELGRQTYPITNPEANVLTGTLDLSVAADEPGTYVLRFVRGTTVLSEGQFTVQ